MSGYGVEMVLKRTDYLVVDDRATSGGTQGFGKLDKISSNGSDIFSGALGENPWSETATAITKDELKGRAYGSLRFLAVLK